METFWRTWPLATAAGLLLLDMVVWNWLNLRWPRWKLVFRVILFLIFSAVMMDAGLSPVHAPLFPDSVASTTLAAVLGIAWWLFGARVLTMILVAILEPRIGGKGHLLQDVLGAIIFLVAVIAAAAYVLELPVKGLLATSGAVAIILGLAIQSTLGDVFSGIVLNATKPYRVDDWIKVDDIEGKVIEIDWRSTRLLSSDGSTAVIPNSLAAKTRIINFSRPDHFHAVTLSLELPRRMRPQLVLEALEKALQGSREILNSPKASVLVQSVTLTLYVYQVTAYVKSRDQQGPVRNLLYDLIYRQLAAAEGLYPPRSRPSSRRAAVLGTVSAMRMLSEAERGELEEKMHTESHAAGEVILAENVVAEALWIVESGIVSVNIEGPQGWIEAGRMGPGEVLGERGILDGSASGARFLAHTECLLYRIERTDLEPWLTAHAELRSALAGLARFRIQRSASLLKQKPIVVGPGGLLHWLREGVQKLQRGPGPKR